MKRLNRIQCIEFLLENQETLIFLGLQQELALLEQLETCDFEEEIAIGERLCQVADGKRIVTSPGEHLNYPYLHDCKEILNQLLDYYRLKKLEQRITFLLENQETLIFLGLQQELKLLERLETYIGCIEKDNFKKEIAIGKRLCQVAGGKRIVTSPGEHLNYPYLYDCIRSFNQLLDYYRSSPLQRKVFTWLDKIPESDASIPLDNTSHRHGNR
jgi:hypothetical protein